MRKLFLLLLVALLAGVGVVAMIETEPGYVLVSYGNYTLETSVWVGAVLLLLLMLTIYFGLGFLSRLRRPTPGQGDRPQQKRGEHSAGGELGFGQVGGQGPASTK